MLAEKDQTSFALDAAERRQLDARRLRRPRAGVRRRPSAAAIAEDAKTLVARLEAAGRDAKHVVGSYMFEIQREAATVVKWEPDAPDVMQGVEPFAHISEPLRGWGLDARLVDPCKAIVGQDDIILFTEKLNVKRARHGGDDHPAPGLPLLGAADADRRPRGHRDGLPRRRRPRERLPGGRAGHAHLGKWPQRTEVEGFGSLEMDPDAFDLGRLEPLEVKAGAVAFFGAFLVHRSLPNRSDRDRRALLYSYQPAGHPHMLELNTLLQRRPANPPGGATS